ncbi:hypothetical protein ACE1CB_36820 [Aerosakkonema sp. BLCC-F2]
MKPRFLEKLWLSQLDIDEENRFVASACVAKKPGFLEKLLVSQLDIDEQLQNLAEQSC